MEENQRIRVPEVEQNDSALKPKKEKTATEKAVRSQYNQDYRERQRLKKQQENVRKGIRSVLRKLRNPLKKETKKPGAKRLLEAPRHLA